MKTILVTLGVALIVLVLVIAVRISVWSSKVSVTAQGNSSSALGFDDFPERPVTVHQAIELAKPHLDASYLLRFEKRGKGGPSANLETDWMHVSLKDEFYYIVKDDYASYTPGFYLPHAVKVNALTGDVIKPE